MFEENNQDFINVDEVTNEFLDVNPVFVIVPIDECDIAGNLCGYDDLQPSYMPIYGGGFPTILPPSEMPIYEGGGGTSATNPPLSNTPGNPVNGPILLTENYNHADVLADDLLTTNIPRIMIAGVGWIGFGGTHLKLRIFRGTTDGDIVQNTDGTITAGGNKYSVKEIRIRRKYCRKKSWVGLNAQFDPDWDMSENSQSIAVFSVHKLRASASAELTAKSGFKIQNGSFEPSDSFSGQVKINVNTGSAKFRTKFEITRKNALVTNVGPGTTGKTIESDGVHYNKKWSERFNYYFQHYYTDLTN